MRVLEPLNLVVLEDDVQHEVLCDWSLMYIYTYVDALVANATKDPSQRIVITGMGAATCFGNDIDAFYNRQAA